MFDLFGALTRLLAPILAYTADEAWGFFAKPDSIHLELFPEQDDTRRDPATARTVESLLCLRALIGQSVEQARQAKLIGNALEAAVTLEIADDALIAELQGREEEIEEFFILSSLAIRPGPKNHVSLVPAQDKKCVRCWRHRPAVAASPEGLCDRCAGVVGKRSVHSPETGEPAR